jgi:hypothetical protein
MIAYLIFGVLNTIAILIWLSSKKHNCNNHEMYFEDQFSRGLFCAKCHKTLSEEIF